MGRPSFIHSLRRSVVAVCVLAALGGPSTQAAPHPTGVPPLSSRAGAAYTLFLDFAGFDFTGSWGGQLTPGSTPAYNLADSDPNTFSAAELANMRVVWTRVAEKYSALDINVTTIDPADALDRPTDAARQQFYDSRPRLMHTVIGGDGSWNGGGGVSYVNKAQFAYTTSGFNDDAGYGWHTNFMFAALAPTRLQFISDATAHELGHGLGLNHQGDHFTAANGTAYNNEYSRNGGFTGTATFSPVMGNSYSVQRGLWRVGRSTTAAVQNDMRVLIANSGIGPFVNDGIGHALADATPLPVADNAVIAGLAAGVIVPTGRRPPTPLGEANYTSDYFAFATDGGALTLTLNDGAQRLTPGVADPGATLAGTLTILDAEGAAVGVGVQADDTLSCTFNGTLPVGTYYARVSSNGGFTSTFDESATYYSMGSYFLSGSGVTAVPEPALVAVITIGCAFLARRRPAR